MLCCDTVTLIPVCATHTVSVIADRTDSPIAIPTAVKPIPVDTATSTAAGTSESPLTTIEGRFNVT